MRDILIIPGRDIHPVYEQHCQAMTRLGIDPKGLMDYGLLYATRTYSGYRELQSYLVHDVVATISDGMLDMEQVTQRVHACIDHIQLVEQYVVPHIQLVCGFFDHTVKLEGFVGNDLMISIQRPDPTPLSYTHDRYHPYAPHARGAEVAEPYPAIAVRSFP
jgi:hypothetical protein